MTKRMLSKAVLALGMSAMAVGSANAGRIVVNNDEWTFNNAAFSAGGPSAGNFLTNVVSFLDNNANGVAGRQIGVFTTNSVYTGSSFFSALGGLGSVTVNPAAFNPSLYDVVFIGGSALPAGYQAALGSYVNGGGGVYLAGGSASVGGGTAAGEAAYWAGFLNPFGLQFAATYNAVGSGNTTGSPTPTSTAFDPAGSSTGLFSGVTQLLYGLGQSVSTNGGNPFASVVEFANAGTPGAGSGLIAVYDGVRRVVPEPGTLALLGLGLLVASAGLRRRAR